MAVRVVQCRMGSGSRLTALVEEETGDGDGALRVLQPHKTLYEYAKTAMARQEPLDQVVRESATGEVMDYSRIYEGRSDWLLMPPFDHPGDPAHCLVTGTGLSHRKSADNRNAMHSAGHSGGAVSDSMRMYHWGEQGGRPAPGEIGTAPEWFWKGDGDIVVGHGAPLDIPNYAEDGGEEAEIAGVYLVGPLGVVYRVGFTAGNEFSDHVMESRNYLCLAPSKLRQCAIGPEIVIGGGFEETGGEAAVVRHGAVIWSQDIASGEANMVHTLSNLEHHHFKYNQHRREGDVHIHFFGTPGFSFGSGVVLQDGDQMSVQFTDFGRPLVNPARLSTDTACLVRVHAL